MILHIANLVRWEWFKTQRRWMPWILLVVPLLLTQMTLWGTYASYPPATRDQIAFNYGVNTESEGAGSSLRSVRISCSDLLAGRLPSDFPPKLRTPLEGSKQDCQRFLDEEREELLDMLERITLPGSLIDALTLMHGMGAILLAIMAASLVGSEFGWGTMRMVLSRGTGRSQLLSAKLMLVALLAAAALAVVAVAMAISSAIVGALVSEQAVSQPEWAEAATTFGRALFSVVPYIALAGLATVVTSSSMAGITTAIAYFFIELFSVALLISLSDWGQNVADYMLGRNITAWMMGSGHEDLDVIFRTSTPIGDFPGMLHAFVVLTVYILVLGGLAFWQFQRKDIGGASGAA